MSNSTASSVKYLRIANTNETVSDITNYVSEPITIGANSKIALDSMSIMIDQNKVIFDAVPYEFQVQNTDNGQLRNVYITEGSYTNYAFLQELTRALNETTENEDNEIRTEWKPIFNTDGKLNIQYLTVLDDDGLDVDLSLSPTMTDDNIVGTRTIVTGDGELGGGFCFTTKKFINAYGIIDFPITTATGASCDEFAAGFINSIPLEDKEELLPTEFYLCVYANKGVGEGQSQFLQVFFNGQEVPALDNYLITDLNADPSTVRCYTRDGKIGIEIVNMQNPELSRIIYEQPYQYNESLHGAFSQYPKQNPTLLILSSTSNPNDAMTITPSPYQNSTSSGISLISKNEDKIGYETYLQLNTLGAAANIPTLHSLTLSNDIRLLLGFSNNYYELDAIGGSFTAENTFNTFVFDKDLLIELPSLLLSSYDGTTNRRRNIIRMVPANDTALVGSRRRFTANFPIFISLTSKEPQILNSLQFRILDSDSGKPLPIIGSNSCYITLIVQSE